MKHKLLKARADEPLWDLFSEVLYKINSKFAQDGRDLRRKSELIREALRIGLREIKDRLDKNNY